MRRLLRQAKAARREFGMTITGALCTMSAMLMLLLTVLLALGGQPVAAPLCLCLLVLTVGLVSTVRQAKRLERSTIESRAPSASSSAADRAFSVTSDLLLGSEVSS